MYRNMASSKRLVQVLLLISSGCSELLFVQSQSASTSDVTSTSDGGDMSPTSSGVVAMEEDLIEEEEIILFDDCDTSTYYSSLPTSRGLWTKDDLNDLVTRTHRNELPVTGDAKGDDDVYYAIMDLDMGSDADTVRLIYRDLNMNVTPFGNPLYWDVERLWPTTQGTSRPSPAFTDVHHIKPADYSVILKKKEIPNYGACGTVEFIEFCTTPATSETTDDTAQDGKAWLPPTQYRGDIARALLYVDMRYGRATGALQRALELKDCGPFGSTGLGYLSQLLEWHRADRPDAAEVKRNNRACSRWQGNRNPFIDYPNLVDQIYGQPDVILEGTNTYESCINVPTPSPTATPNTCSSLRVGDVPVFLLNSDDPDEVIFFAISDIPGGLELFLTDNAWDGEKLLSTEGTVSMIVPDAGIQAGSSFGFGGPQAELNELWSTDENFKLSVEGDNVFLYCRDADDLPYFLSAFSYAGNGVDSAAATSDGSGTAVVSSNLPNQDLSWWMPTGLSPEEYGTRLTALPESLESAGSLFLPVHYDNWLYNGTRQGGIGLLRLTFVNPENWEGTNDGRYEIATPEGESASTTITATTTMVVVVLSTMTWFLVSLI